MSDLNTRPIHIQARDVYHNLIQNATIKVIERKSGKILYHQQSPSGEIILDDIEKLKDCHAFRVEIEHPHYKSKPKTNAPCIRGANLNKPHTLEFYYQDKLLVSSVYGEVRHTQQTSSLDSRLESKENIKLHLKAQYNQDSIPNKDKQSQAQKQKYQEQKRQTKWGYILFDKEVDIDSKLKELTKDSTIPLTELKEFQRITKEDSIAFATNQTNTSNATINITQTNIAYIQNNQTSIDSESTNNTDKDFNNTESKDYLLGEEIEIYFKEQWKDKRVRFFAYVYNPHKDVGVDVELEESIPPNIIRIKTEDDSGEYIEIEFDENDTLKDINNNDDGELNDLLHQAKDILYELSPFSSAELAYNNFTAGNYKDALIDAITILPMAKAFKAEKIANKIKNIISKDKRKEDVRIHTNINKNSNTNAGKKIKSKYATKQEVINAIENKYRLKKEGYKNVYMAKDNKQIKEIWEDITEGTEVLEYKIDGYGDILKIRKLSDGTIIQLRKKSSGGEKAKKEGKGGTGGSTIEIDASAKKPNQIKIHNKAQEDGDW